MAHSTKRNVPPSGRLTLELASTAMIFHTASASCRFPAPKASSAACERRCHSWLPQRCRTRSSRPQAVLLPDTHQQARRALQADSPFRGHEYCVSSCKFMSKLKHPPRFSQSGRAMTAVRSGCAGYGGRGLLVKPSDISIKAVQRVISSIRRLTTIFRPTIFRRLKQVVSNSTFHIAGR